VFHAVTETWDNEQIEKLAILLRDHMQSIKAVDAPPPKPSVQPERRV
jgi:hypothetical protein